MPRDEWGQDPTVQMMRRVFSEIEAIQRDLLDRLAVSPFDHRLRPCREKAKDLFEQVWPVAVRKGVTRSEEEAAILYAYCLGRTLSRWGIRAPSEILPKNDRIIKFLDDQLK